MAQAGKTFEVKFTGDTSDLSKAFQKLQRDAGGLGKSVSVSSGVMKAALATISVGAVVRGLQSAVMAASTLSESISKANVVFGKNAESVQNWSKTTSKAFGVNRQAALEAAGTYGNLFRAFGLTEQQSYTMSTSLVELAADMASFNNVPIEDALLALRSGLSGETEPLKRFGVAINDQRLKLKAAEMGLGTYKGMLPVAIKTQAAFALIMQDTALAQGDVSRTSGGLANQLKFLKAGLEDAKAGFGEALLPIVLNVVTAFNDKLLPAIQRIVEAIKFQGAGGGLKALGVEISNVLYNLDGTAKKLKDLLLLFIGIKTVLPLVLALRASWEAVSKSIEGTATTTKIAMGVMKSALVSTGIGLLVVALGAVVQKLIDARIEATALDKEVTVVVDNGKTQWQRYGKAVYDGVTVKLNAASLAATRLDDVLMKSGIMDVKRKRTGYFPGAGGGGEKPPGDNSGAVAAMAKLVKAQSDAASKALEKMNQSLKDAKDKLKELKDAKDAYRDSVKQAIISQFAFSSILDDFTNRQKNAQESTLKLTEAELGYQDALKDPSDIKGIAKALDDLTAAQKANADATANKKTFLQIMRDQAGAAVAFADKVKKLMVMGLSQSGLDQVIAAGADAGGKIADELIAGGASAISETNTLLDSVKKAAVDLGTSAADTFYQAGVTQGQAMVNGIVAAVKAAGFRIVSGAVALPAALQKALDSGKLSKDQIKQINGLLKGVPALANGGVVNKPTLALIGEAGPEAVVPLNGRNAGMGNTINLTVNAGMGADGNQIGREIVDIIKRYERVSGPVFASA